MKLAFCLFKYFPYGGLQRDFLRIAKECLKRGHEIHVYTMEATDDLPQEFHLHMLHKKGWQNHTRCVSFVKQCETRLKQGQYDLVIGFNKMPWLDVYYAADICYQSRIHEKHGLFYGLLPRYRELIKLEKAVFQHGYQTEIMLIANAQKHEYQMYYQTENERFHLLPPGIDKDRIASDQASLIRQSLRASFHLMDEHIVLLMIGSGFKTKGLDRVMVGIAALPYALQSKVRLFVIGEDNQTPFLTLAKKLHLLDQVMFLGGRSDVPSFLLAADLLLHPAYHENTGTVLLEALVSGLPVLTVDVCGYAHYIKEANAGIVLSSPFEQLRFNEALQTMIVSDKRKIWQNNGLAFAKNADIYSLPDKACDLIEQIGLKKKKYSSQVKLSFDKMMQLQGECFRKQNNRMTQRIVLNHNDYFIKQHFGIGWREIFKNMIQCRLPVVSAKNEWRAIKKCQAIGISTPNAVAFDERGFNPAKRQSFVLLEALTSTISLEDLTRDWKMNSPAFAFKMGLIKEVAHIAKMLHEHGMNHRDFYICHFLLDIKQHDALKLYLIDLHRVQYRKVVPERWLVKDLAALYFSSKNTGLTKRDRFRFMKAYTKKSLRHLLEKENYFWKKVMLCGERLYRDHQSM